MDMATVRVVLQPHLENLGQSVHPATVSPLTAQLKKTRSNQVFHLFHIRGRHQLAEPGLAAASHPARRALL